MVNGIFEEPLACRPKGSPVGRISEFSGVAPAAKQGLSKGDTMRTLTSFCSGLILVALTTVIGFDGTASAHPDVGSSVEVVNRTRKADRLPTVHVHVPRAPVSDARLLDGCEPLVSVLTRSNLARIAGRCLS